MYRAYSVPMENVTVTNSADLAYAFVNVGSSASLEFLFAWMDQKANATSAQQSFALGTQVTAFPTLTSTTPRKLDLGDPSSVITGGTAGAAGTSGTNASATGGGAKTYLFNSNFNALNGGVWRPATPFDTFKLNAGGASGFGLYAPVAPATLTNWSGGVYFRELG